MLKAAYGRRLTTIERGLFAKVAGGRIRWTIGGQRLGRPMTAGLHADKVRKLHRGGVSKAEIARRLRIGRTSVRRILA